MISKSPMRETRVKAFLRLGPRSFALGAGLALCLTSACATPSSYMGISLAPGGAAEPIQALARRAQGVDTQALLQLGIAFEEGRGFERDTARAERFFDRAAVVETMWVYQPGVGGATGRVIPVKMAPGGSKPSSESGGAVWDGPSESSIQFAYQRHLNADCVSLYDICPDGAFAQAEAIRIRNAVCTPKQGQAICRFQGAEGDGAFVRCRSTFVRHSATSSEWVTDWTTFRKTQRGRPVTCRGK